ncbi:unnamed protein product [Callosobruchus maculatus]|uniref:Uncharacterized protein n=1 Tax=Callosobruchus maculatus TaxID=64391 RepID=A0A653CFK8_CALMS|nr:unnamed protein product [Callosobruchus maculatus]VEN45192.1 unnamed protein product [Callosobruchus maculatus]VEN45860.1 unnamed protein product [Callosobruchus maculatus]VEN45905.1 unnamed protein product [Callosobruchus maculatus]
MQDLHEELLQV